MTISKTISRWIKTCAAALCFAASSGAHAQIPTTDVLLNANTLIGQIATLAEWATQAESMIESIAQYKAQLDQAKTHYNSITGARGLGGILNSTTVKSALPAEWTDLMGSIKSTAEFTTQRTKYPAATAGRPKLAALYDVAAAQAASAITLYKKSNARNSQVQDLMGQIDSASDPAAKADLANRLLSEQNAIAAERQFIAMLQENQKLELSEAGKTAATEMRCREFKKAGC
jgi:type IV secretion system protein VirB5